MRHRVYGKHLGRSKNERTALFKNLVQSLIISEKIETSEAKARAIKGLVDKIITQAKSPTTRRLVSQFLVSKTTQDKLFKDVITRLKNRTSGYTSVIKLGRRVGDGTMMVSMKLLTEEKVVAAEKTAPKKAETKELSATSSQPSEKSEKKETMSKAPANAVAKKEKKA